MKPATFKIISIQLLNKFNKTKLLYNLEVLILFTKLCFRLYFILEFTNLNLVGFFGAHLFSMQYLMIL